MLLNIYKIFTKCFALVTLSSKWKLCIFPSVSPASVHFAERVHSSPFTFDALRCDVDKSDDFSKGAFKKNIY